MDNKRKIQGVTLIEVLLVLVIMSAILVMTMGYIQQKTEELRRNRASLQMQQILNAGLAYYITKSTWPQNLSDLQPMFLPSTAFRNPWGQGYNINGKQVGLFYVTANVLSSGNAQLVAGKLPLSFVSTAAGAASDPPNPGGCTTTLAAGCTYVVSSVNIPGQNLNNATAVNFAGLYHSGACVPEPKCPVDSSGHTMKAAIYVVPAGVSGVNDPLSGTASTAYPISSFIAFARGGADGNPSLPNSPGPLACETMPPTGSPMECNYDFGLGYPRLSEGATQKYWRVCLRVMTQKGFVAPNVMNPGGAIAARNQGVEMGTLLAFTRCVPNNGVDKPQGSDFTVWDPGQNWQP